MKSPIKLFTNIFFILLTAPLVYCFKLGKMVVYPNSLFWSISQLLSLAPGKSGSYLRKNFFRFTMTRCHPDCAIMFGTIFSQVDTEIGKGVYIGPQCNIGSCRIENFCTIGSGVHILSGKNQHFFDDPDTPLRDQGGVYQKITIGEDTWIGNSAIIMANVGKKCIVGAGSVVTKEVEDYSIVAGNPARLLKMREKKT